MRIGVVTIFPEMFQCLRFGVVGRAMGKGLIDVRTFNPRDYATDNYRSVDDYPYGGGQGMVMKLDVLVPAIRDAKDFAGGPVILLSPQGVPFNQEYATELAKEPGIVLVCGRYEGVDERIMELVDEEISIGDYVLSGGELPAMVVIDAVVRLLPGVLGDDMSPQDESFQDGLLEYPQYTRPSSHELGNVPEILLTGHHAKIARWRLKERIRRTLLKRPDLLLSRKWSEEERELLSELWNEFVDLFSKLGVGDRDGRT